MVTAWGEKKWKTGSCPTLSLFSASALLFWQQKPLHRAFQGRKENVERIKNKNFWQKWKIEYLVRYHIITQSGQDVFLATGDQQKREKKKEVPFTRWHQKIKNKTDHQKSFAKKLSSKFAAMRPSKTSSSTVSTHDCSQSSPTIENLKPCTLISFVNCRGKKKDEHKPKPCAATWEYRSTD